MARLKDYILLIAFYISINKEAVKCECQKENIQVWGIHKRLIFAPSSYERNLNQVSCKNVNFTDELMTKYEISDDNIQQISISNSVISAVPISKTCLRLIINNSTFNISNTHLLDKMPELSILSIISSNLLTFDINPITAIKSLDLSNNALTSLNSSAFRKNKLIALNVSSNEITNIYCENVTELIDLSYNSLDCLEEINCTFAPSLEYLSLNNNNFKNISKKSLLNLRSLRKLDLSWNQIEVVSLIFDDLESLLNLKLDNNIIYRLEVGCFLKLTKLMSLDLSYNEIVSLPHGIFTELDELRVLDLSYNDIFRLDVNNLYSCRSVWVLYLAGNMLEDFDIDKLSEFNDLKNLSLSFKDISCFKLENYKKLLLARDVELEKGEYFYTNNVDGIKCTLENKTDLYRSSFELSLNSLKEAHISLTIITICFLILMIIFVFILCYRYKL